ncbi:MAG: DEAD/DEAH box helicase [Deltaproteobacteria bacterium]|nr:DEAD/DEAH box helicase [Deltaproteobacteria bacterium]
MADSSAVEIQAGSNSHSFNSFESFPINDDLKAGIAALGYTEPTSVQAKVIEPAVAGKNLFVKAHSGSGKISAFGIPIIERVSQNLGLQCEPRALILTSTRELAYQVAQELRGLAAKKPLRIYAIYGGMPMGRQIVSLRSGVDIVVGTPGRILDHIRRKNLLLSGLQTVVLNDADEMLSMGFWEDVAQIVDLCPTERQTMFFSSSVPYEIAQASTKYLSDPVLVEIENHQLKINNIDNIFFKVTSELPKPKQLLYVLEAIRPQSAIIYCNTISETDLIAKFLTQSGFVAQPLASSMRQRDRDRLIERIKAAELRFMVATDVATRGIDINSLTHIINYSLPEFNDVYLHRAGRIEGESKLAAAISLLDEASETLISQLEQKFNIKFNERNLPSEEEASRLRSERIMKELTEKASVAEVGAHLPVAQEILASPDQAPQVIAYLLQSYYAAAAAETERQTIPTNGYRNSRSQSRYDHNGMGHLDDDSRRRGRRGRRGRRRNEHGYDSSYSDHDGYDTIDANEALAGDFAAVAPIDNAMPPAVDGEAVLNDQNGSAEEAGDAINDGFTRIRVNIGFDDGFKGRGSVAKRIAALAGLTDGTVFEVESRRQYSILKASPQIAELLIDRVDGAPIGKKILLVELAQ